MLFRLATVADSAALLKIYAQYIATPITFEYVLPAEQEFAARIAAITECYPYLVCEEEGSITAYAYAYRHMERAAYQWNAGLSVYVDAAHRSQGLGKKIYTCLMEILSLQGMKTVYAGVTAPNPRSEALHLSLGFQPVGTYHCAGFKAGAWHDVTWFEKALAPYDTPPAPILPIGQIAPAKLRTVLAG